MVFRVTRGCGQLAKPAQLPNPFLIPNPISRKKYFKSNFQKNPKSNFQNIFITNQTTSTYVWINLIENESHPIRCFWQEDSLILEVWWKGKFMSLKISLRQTCHGHRWNRSEYGFRHNSQPILTWFHIRVNICDRCTQLESDIYIVHFSMDL